MSLRHPPSLPYTGDPEADRLLGQDPLALLIGFLLDQQVTVQQAFRGPLELRRRIGSLDAPVIASMDPADLEAAFRLPPALHRFPADMARRTQALCAAVVADYEGEPVRIWTEAADAHDLQARLLALPGIGAMKAGTIMAVLARRFGLELPGLAEALPAGPTLADVDSPAALAEYQAHKRAAKQARRAGERAQPG